MSGEISKTADKALLILIALGEESPATPLELSRRTGMNRTVTQRLLMTLALRGFVTGTDGRYTLASRIRTIADAVQPELRRVVDAHADELAAQLHETVVVQVLDGDAVVVLHESRPATRFALQARHEVASRSPLDMSASGQAILAWMDDASRERVLRGSPTPELLERLNEVRESGFATTSDTLQSGVSGLAVAISRNGRTLGSIAVVVPTVRIEVLDGHRVALQRTARRIERELGPAPNSRM